MLMEIWTYQTLDFLSAASVGKPRVSKQKQWEKIRMTIPAQQTATTEPSGCLQTKNTRHPLLQRFNLMGPKAESKRSQNVFGCPCCAENVTHQIEQHIVRCIILRHPLKLLHQLCWWKLLAAIVWVCTWRGSTQLRACPLSPPRGVYVRAVPHSTAHDHQSHAPILNKVSICSHGF